jgi:nucleotide-binding universal stress UspA family protein
MNKVKVLIAIDEPDIANIIVNTACCILDKNLTEITLLNINEVAPAEEGYFYKEPMKFIEHESEKSKFAYIENFLEKEDFNYRGFVYKDGDTAKNILEISEKENFDLIVLGSHNKHVFERLLLGSVSYKISRLSKKSVLVVKPALPPKITPLSDYSVCFAVDSSDFSLNASKKIASFLDKKRANINILNVIKPLQEIIPSEAYFYIDSQKIIEEINSASDNILKKIAVNVLKHSLTMNKKYHLEGDPVQTILEEADKNKCDLITLASHGTSGFADMLLGTVSSKIMDHSDIPVLIIK